ncbi:MAG TPA: DUF4162 domain-containing protein, partial [Solimonas sp.]|nr:DUF4162 domain-containing protein [Solimonas sp.]
TVILTTHYIEEAEEMADRIGVIHRGELIVVERTQALMRQLGKKQLTLHLKAPLGAVPEVLAHPALSLGADGQSLVYTYDVQAQETGVAALLKRLGEQGIEVREFQSSQSSLEDIFVNLVRARS